LTNDYVFITSSSTIADRSRCSVGQFGQNVNGREYFAPKVVSTRKLEAVIFTRYLNSDIAAL